MHWIPSLAALTRSHLPEIAISLTAMILVVLSPAFNKGMKAMAGPLHWILRYGLFVLLATVGSGLLTHFGVRAIQAALRGLSDGRLLAAVAGAHLLIAWILKRENHI
jgi:hypothetical protein